MPASHVLRVGREPDNDFVVNLATVSGYHARVTWSGRPGEGMIEDIGSTNGTAVGSPDRRVTRAAFTASDTIYLGTHAVSGAELLSALAALNAPGKRRAELTIGMGSVMVGRDSGCDRVIDSPVVSSRHARLTRRDDGTISVEDLRSANGTFINGRRIDPIGTARPGDTIALGSHSLVLALDPAVPQIAPVAPPILVPPAPPSSSFGAELAEAWRAVWIPAWRPVTVLVLGPVLGLVVVLTSGFDPTLLTGPGGPGSGGSALVAPLVSRLGSVTVLLGLIGAAGLIPDASAIANPRRWPAWVSVPAALCVVACLMAWIPSLLITDGELGIASALSFLMLGAGAGFGLGQLIRALAPRPAVAWLVVAMLLAPIWLIGGEGRVWKQLPGWAKTGAAINPARWTFEGLMLSASERLPIQVAESEPPTDLAEPYFPAETDRIGPRGAALALVAMMLGWGAAAAFIATSLRSLPGGRPAP